MSRIVVLGSANMDLVVRQPRLARPGETLAGTSFATGPGGKGLNRLSPFPHPSRTRS
ncbi:hypothetical protein [Microbacterium hominis]|uniref:hypothetical protein n=1 Tax=Microbacterium hominis TaxID=162426 RepID=UPI000AB7B846|nr:hypothetical protein [Microbacterium hominis]